MEKFAEDFKDFYQSDLAVSLLTPQKDSTLLSSLQGQQDRWDDRDKLFTFKRVIQENGYLFKDKTVLDLRCGLGLFSVFAARAGAKRVFAVDNSLCLQLTQKIVERNGLGGVVQIFNGKVSEAPIPLKSIDVIICDWVGSFGINDDILGELISARDRLLAPNGLVG